MAGSCEHGDEFSDFIKKAEFREWLCVLSASQGLCSMELASC
jgi:hypothetical protein